MEIFWFWALAFMAIMYVVLDGFDIGSGILHLFVARKDAERRQVLASIGPVWDGNEVWLLALGGVMFFAFPKLLATALSGFYLPITMVVWLLIGRALGIELRHQVSDRLWTQFWDAVLAGSSLLLAIFFGAALGNVVRGVSLGPDGIFFSPLWTDFRVGGQTGILDWYTVLIGVHAAAALAYHGGVWLFWKTDEAVSERSARIAKRLWPALLILSALSTAASLAVQPNTLNNLREYPWGAAFALLFIAGLIYSRVSLGRGNGKPAFFSSAAHLAGLLGCAAIGSFPYMLPSRDPQFGLRADAIAVPQSSLVTGLYWWLPGILLVLAYTSILYWKAPDKYKISEIPSDH